MNKTLWSGDVAIIENGDDGKTHIVYRADDGTDSSVYIPDGFFEKKAVSGLVKKLTGA